MWCQILNAVAVFWCHSRVFPSVSTNPCSSMFWPGETFCMPPQFFRHLVLVIEWHDSDKSAEENRGLISSINQKVFVSLHTCLLACHLFVTPVCMLPTAQSPACLRAWPCLPTWLYLLVCLRATWPARWPLVFFRAWLVGWLTFGLIRITYRRGTHTQTHVCAGTHKHECTGILFSVQLARSLWLELLTIHSSAPQSYECVRHSV